MHSIVSLTGMQQGFWALLHASFSYSSSCIAAIAPYGIGKLTEALQGKQIRWATEIMSIVKYLLS